MDLIVGIVLLAWCLVLLGYKQISGIDLDQKTIIQSIVSGIGSVIILGPIVFSKLKNIKLPSLPKPKPNPKPEKEVDDMKEDDTSNDFHLDSEELNDFKALNYLKDRAMEMNSQEALDLVIKLNTILFSVTRQYHRNRIAGGHLDYVSF